jgi:integrase
MLFAEAISRGTVGRDPWADVDRKRVIPRGTKRTRVIQEDEQEKVMAKMGDESRRAFIVMLGTGVREDELLRLESRHCDFDGGLLRLTADIVKGKTRSSDTGETAREVPMQPAVVQALREQMAARQAGEVGPYYRRKQGPQLWNMSRTTLSEAFTRAILAVGIEHFTQHDTRRTFGTRCAEAGVKPHRLQAWMGHADISTTMRFYVHDQRNASRDEMQRLDLKLPKTMVIVRRAGQAV